MQSESGLRGRVPRGSMYEGLRGCRAPLKCLGGCGEQKDVTCLLLLFDLCVSFALIRLVNVLRDFSRYCAHL